MYSHIVQYKDLIFQLTLSLTISTTLHFLHFPSFFLTGLNTYIHPDDVNPSKPNSGGPKVAIRRPSDTNPNQGSGSLSGFQSLSSRTTSELRNRKGSNSKLSKEPKFEFDESKAQIFRLKLSVAHVVSRLYYDSYRSCFNTMVVACCCFGLNLYLNVGDGNGDGILRSGVLVPVVIGCVGLFRLLVSLFRVSLERSGFRRLEREFGLVVGVLGFFGAMIVCLRVYPGVFGFEFGSIDGYGVFFVGLISGCVTGFLYLAAGKNARAFWLGTDQIRCNLLITSCSWFDQIILYVSYLMLGFTSLLWITPFSEILVNKNIGVGKGAGGSAYGGGHREKLVGNVGMSEADFVKFRVYCLLISGVLQVIALRINVQTYLNEAVLAWYQRLHASVVPDLDYSRAKVFLHNHYLCLAVLHFLAPAALMLLSLGLSQAHGGLFDNFQLACGMLPCSAFTKEVGVFLAWWVSLVWFIFTSVYLAFYRRGSLYVS